MYLGVNIWNDYTETWLLQMVSALTSRALQSYVMLHSDRSCTRSLTLFLRHYNTDYLWYIFSISPLHYFRKKAVLGNSCNVEQWCLRLGVISYCFAAAWAASTGRTVSINCARIYFVVYKRTCFLHVICWKEYEFRLVYRVMFEILLLSKVAVLKLHSSDELNQDIRLYRLNLYFIDKIFRFSTTTFLIRSIFIV